MDILGDLGITIPVPENGTSENPKLDPKQEILDLEAKSETKKSKPDPKPETKMEIKKPKPEKKSETGIGKETPEGKINLVDNLKLKFGVGFYERFNFSRRNLRNMKRQLLAGIIKRCGSGPAQGSDAWKIARNELGFIGGSELHTIYKNPKSGIKQILGRKLGIGAQFSGNTATRWGNVFENIAKQIVMANFKVDEIHEFSRIKDKIPYLSYSPDGICIIKRKATLEDLEIIRYLIVLLEFKCPFSREVKGEIPEEYRLQINAGLLHISGIEAGLFVNSKFRRCPLTELYSGSCVARGIILFRDKFYNSDTESEDVCIDCGKLSDYELGDVFKRLENKSLIAEFVDPEFSNPETDEEKNLERYAKTGVSKILPWKLHKCDMIFIEPDPSYLPIIEEITSEYLHYAKKFMDAPKETHRKLFEELFPSSR